MEPGTGFHLFGGCTIEVPTAEELTAASDCLQLLRKFEQSIRTRTAVTWDLSPDFDELVEKDLKAWKQLGVERPNHLVQPSGNIESPLALHLYNPTYYVADPESIETDDPTNPTIQDLNECGLSSEHCFMFDQISRRERTDELEYFYTQNIRQNHRDFVRKVRRAMSAVVEICFGDDAFREVSRAPSKLRQFPLWGKFKPVRLYLELSESDPDLVKRLVVRAYHPQHLYKAWNVKKSDEIYKKPQALAILMAIQLASLQDRIDAEPFLLSDKFAQKKRPRLPAEQTLQMQKNNQASNSALRTAFPEKYDRFKLRLCRSQREREIFHELENLSSNSRIPPAMMNTLPDGELPENEQVLRISQRHDIIQSFAMSFERLCDDLVGSFHDNESDETEEEGAEDLSSEIFDYDSIPSTLRTWLGLQDGLKIHGQPLNSRHSLELAFCLLQKRSVPEIDQLPSEHLARMVALLYARKVQRPPKPLIQELGIPGEPNDIIHLKCSKCQKPVLDDAFPFFVTECPSIYLIEVCYRGMEGTSGCGMDGCKGFPCLIPVNRAVHDYTRPERRAIASTIERKDKAWKAPFLRTGEHLDGLDHTVHVKCVGSGSPLRGEKTICGKERYYEKASWTIHTPARFVIPRLKCPCTETYHFFRPVNSDTPVIIEIELKKALQGFKKVGCNLADYPKIPDLIFEPKTQGKKQRDYSVRAQLLKEAKADQKRADRESSQS